MTTLKRISILLALCACLAAMGCGSDEEKGDPVPAEQAAALQGRLDETEARLANGSVGACEDILEDTMPEVGKILDALPASVDADVRDALEQSFDNLWSLVESECQDLEQDEPAQTQTQPEPETETTETPTETTETAPLPETDTVPIPEEETIPPDGDGNSDGLIPENGGGGGVGPGSSKAKKDGKEKQ